MSILYTLLFVANQFVYAKIYRFCLEKAILLRFKRYYSLVELLRGYIPLLSSRELVAGTGLFLLFFGYSGQATV
jgi:hypothetical protein